MPRKKNVIVLHETILSKVDEIVAQGQAFLKIGLSYVRTNVSNSLHTLLHSKALQWLKSISYNLDVCGAGASIKQENARSLPSAIRF